MWFHDGAARSGGGAGEGPVKRSSAAWERSTRSSWATRCSRAGWLNHRTTRDDHRHRGSCGRESDGVGSGAVFGPVVRGQLLLKEEMRTRRLDVGRS
jgi:hypothetical protein